MLTGEMKARCISELQKFVGDFQERRSKVTHEVMREFTRPRKMQYGGNPHLAKVTPVPAGPGAANANGVPTGPVDGAEKSAGKDGRGTKGERKAAKLAAKKDEKMAVRQKDKEGEAS